MVDYTPLTNATAGIGQSILSAFDKGREDARNRRTESALAAYVTNPTPEGVAEVAKYNPALGLQLQDREASRQAQMQKAQMQQIQADLQQRAAQGDAAALGQLAGIDINAWQKLSTAQKDQIKQSADYIGNAALNISRLPPEQRAAAWDAAVVEGERLGIRGLAQQAGQYSEQALQGALAKAGMVKDFISATEPHYQVIPEGGTLVDTRNASAVSGYVGSQDAPVQVQSVEQARSLPPGTRFIDPNGNIRVVPGGSGGNAAGGFPQ